jgi:uncharacterized protein (TIGR03435 family)
LKRAHVRLLSGVMIVTGLAASAPRPTLIRAQTPAPERLPSFDVASVKQNTSVNPRTFNALPGGRLVVTNSPLKGLIAAAFGMADIQALIPVRILGGPDWIDSQRYDIDAKARAEFQFAPGGPPKDPPLMLRSLLEERFKLVTHRETREMPIFELVVAREDGRLGPGLHKSSVDCDAVIAARRAGSPEPPRQRLEPPPCGLIGGPAHTIAGAVTMQQLAGNLSNHLERLVVDKTGLTDRFDFNFGWTPDQMPTAAPPPGVPPVDPNGPSLITALQEQLGFKVVAGKGPVDVLVIDQIKELTPN